MVVAKAHRLEFFLKKTIRLLKNTEHYEWGHSGACNCGHLAQVITGETKANIHRWSMEKEGDWSEKAKAYCATSGYTIDKVIRVMLSQGLTIEDIHHIEYLNHPKILAQLEGDKRYLAHNQKEDVIAYFEAWLKLLKSKSSRKQVWNSRHSTAEENVPVYDSVPEWAI